MKYFAQIASGFMMLALLSEVSYAKPNYDTQGSQQPTRYAYQNNSSEQVTDSARDYLDKTISQIINQLEFLKKQVDSNQKLDEAQKADFSKNLDAKIIWLLEKREGVYNKSYEEVKVISAEIREYWKNNQYDVKKILGEVSTVRIDLAIEQLEAFAEKVEEKIQTLKSNGDDLSAPEEFLQDFRLQIHSARISNQHARDSFREISNTDESAENFYTKGQTFIKESHSFLRQSHRSLKNSVQAIQGLRR